MYSEEFSNFLFEYANENPASKGFVSTVAQGYGIMLEAYNALGKSINNSSLIKLYRIGHPETKDMSDQEVLELINSPKKPAPRKPGPSPVAERLHSNPNVTDDAPISPEDNPFVNKSTFKPIPRQELLKSMRETMIQHYNGFADYCRREGKAVPTLQEYATEQLDKLYKKKYDAWERNFDRKTGMMPTWYKLEDLFPEFAPEPVKEAPPERPDNFKVGDKVYIDSGKYVDRYGTVVEYNPPMCKVKLLYGTYRTDHVVEVPESCLLSTTDSRFNLRANRLFHRRPDTPVGKRAKILTAGYYNGTVGTIVKANAKIATIRIPLTNGKTYDYSIPFNEVEILENDA